MIKNATILRADASTPTPGGEFAWTNGDSIVIRCCLSGPSSQQQWTIDELKLDATDVIFVEFNDAATAAAAMGIAAVAWLANARLAVQLDAESISRIYLVRRATERLQSPTSHFELMVKQQ